MLNKKIYFTPTVFLSVTTFSGCKKDLNVLFSLTCKPKISSTWYLENVGNFSKYFILLPSLPEVKIKKKM